MSVHPPCSSTSDSHSGLHSLLPQTTAEGRTSGPRASQTALPLPCPTASLAAVTVDGQAGGGGG